MGHWKDTRQILSPKGTLKPIVYHETFASVTNEYHQDSFVFGCHQGLVSTSIRCEECIPSRIFRRDLYGHTTGI